MHVHNNGVDLVLQHPGNRELVYRWDYVVIKLFIYHTVITVLRPELSGSLTKQKTTTENKQQQQTNQTTKKPKIKQNKPKINK